METIQCPTCRRELAADDVNLTTGLAKCRQCNKAFRIPAPVAGGIAPKEPVPLPSGISQHNEGSDLVIVRRWFGVHAIFLTFFCVIWDLFVLGFMKAGSGGGRSVFPVFWLFPHFYVGVGLTYYVLCLWLNKTVFRVNSARIDIRNGPLPSFGNKTVPADEVDQLYCRRVIGNKGSVSFRLAVVLKSGKQVNVGGSFQAREQVLYLEQQIEQALGISDRFVEAEDRGYQPPASVREAFDLVTKHLRKPKPPGY